MAIGNPLEIGGSIGKSLIPLPCLMKPEGRYKPTYNVFLGPTLPRNLPIAKRPTGHVLTGPGSTDDLAQEDNSWGTGPLNLRGRYEDRMYGCRVHQ